MRENPGQRGRKIPLITGDPMRLSVKALALPDLRERYVSAGIEPVGSAPDEFAAAIREDIAR